ncbi:purine-cytosine permease family protein [Tsukamurella soli]|uniref:Cytosine permease n=1 Tax=Tsukamurella soli TaxID=644556 RepID=A0ABP8K363_9ACTN
MTVTDDPIGDRRPRIAIERRGIEHIPAGERRGHPLQLGAMWSGLTLNVLSVVYGTILVQMGLSWWQAVAASILGNLSWILTGIVSLAGPAAGTTTFGVTQLVFGRWGVRPVAFFNWIMMLGYEVLDLVIMVLAAKALLGMAGIAVPDGLELALVLVLSVAQAILPLLGHAALTRVVRVLAVPFAACFVIMAALVAGKVHTGGTPPTTLAVFLTGVALTASSSGLGWSPTSADYSRYLPQRTSRSRIVLAVSVGGAVPQILLMMLGAAIAIAMPKATDPVSGLPTVFPHWLVAGYLVLVIVQMVALNAADLYSSGVTLQAMGLRLRRWQAVVLDGCLCAVVGAIVVSSNGFYTFVNNFLLFMIVWFAPWTGVFVTDMWCRRGRYDDSTAPLRRLFAPRALCAQATGMVASVLCLHTSIFTGPVSAALGHADLSLVAGILVGAGTYLLLRRSGAETSV